MAQVLGIDFGGTKILAGVVDTDTGEVLASAKKRTRSGHGHEEILDRLLEAIREARSGSGARLQAAGIGVAGQVDVHKNVLTRAPNLPDTLLGSAIVETVQREAGAHVFLFNDVVAAAAGEATFGAGKDHRDFVCIFVGTGIGGAIYRDGAPYAGATNTAGELGHMVIDVDGRICGCGGRGHLEAYASRTAIVKTILAAMRQGRQSVLRDLVDDPNPDNLVGVAIRSKALAHAVDTGDQVTIEMVDAGARFLAAGLASIVNFYNPPRIILGGGVIDAVDRLFERAAGAVSREALKVPGEQVTIVKAALGDFSGIVGASVLAGKRSPVTV